MAVITLPALLAAEAGGRRRFDVEAATLQEALMRLPIADLIFDETGALRALVNVYVNGVDARADLRVPVDGDADVRVVAAIAGGAPCCGRG